MLITLRRSLFALGALAFILLVAPKAYAALTIGSTSIASDSNLSLQPASNVGIGNLNPQALLHLGTAGSRAGIMKLDGATSGTVTIQPAATAGTWTLTLPSTAGTNGQALTTDGNGVTSWTTVAGGGGGLTCSGCTNNVIPKTTGAGTLGDSDIYNDSGNVGIGITNPTARLDVAGGSIKLHRLGDADGGINYSSNTLLLEGSYWNCSRGCLSNTIDMQLQTVIADSSPLDYHLSVKDTNSADLMVITNSGKVGIGTSIPSATLDIIAPYDTSIKIETFFTGHVGAFTIEDGNGVVSLASNGEFGSWPLAFKFSGDEAMRITPDGFVGVGTPDPTELLDVNSDNVRIRAPKTPSDASDSCDQGEISWDANYIYVCVSTDTWKRSVLSTW